MKTDHDFYAEIIGTDEIGWTLKYCDLNDNWQRMKLDSEDEASALDEAADFLEIEKDEIEVTYD